MPIRDKVYDKLKSIGLTDSKEDFFNYYDNDENVRKQAYNKLREAGLTDSEEDFYKYMTPQKTAAQQIREQSTGEPYTHEYDENMNLVGGTAYKAPEPYQYKPEVQQHILQNKPDMFNSGKGVSLMDAPLHLGNNQPDPLYKPQSIYNTLNDAYGAANDYAERVNARAEIAERNLKDPIVQKGRTEADMRGLLTEIDGLLEKEHGRLKSKTPVGRNAFNALMGSTQYNQSNKGTRKNVSNLDAAKRLLEQSQYIVDAAKRGDTGILNDTWQGFKDSLEAEDFTFGLADAASSAAILDAIKKVEKGEKLTESEDKLLRASAINMAVQYNFANDLGRAYKMGQVTAESVPFMLEMAINPISSFGKASAKTLLNYGLKSFAKQVGKGLAKGAAAGAGMAITTGLGGVAAGTTDRLAGNYNYGVDFDGKLYAEKKRDTMGVGEAAVRSFATRAIENQSEMIFRAFDGFGDFMKGVNVSLPGGVNKFFDLLKNNKAADAYRAIKNSKVFRNYLVKDFRNAIQIGGYVEEAAEEAYNNLANFAIGEMSWDKLTDLDNNIDMLLGLAPTQVMFGLLGLGGAGAMRYQTRRTLEDLQATMNEQQRKQLEGLLDMGLDAREVDVRGFIRNVMQNENYTIDNKRDMIKAAFYVAKQNGIDELTQADVVDKVNAENSLIDSVTDPSTGMYSELTAILSDGNGGQAEMSGYIVGWLGEGDKAQPIFVPEGMENTYENRRVLKPGQWKPEDVQQMPAEEVKVLNEEMIREEAAVQAENEARWNPNVPEPQEGLSFFNGEEEVTIVGMDGNGGLFVAPGDEYRAAQGNEKKMAEVVNRAMQLGVVPIEQYKDAMTVQLEADEKASNVKDPVINGQAVVRDGDTYQVLGVDSDGVQVQNSKGITKVPLNIWKSWVYDYQQANKPSEVTPSESVGEQVNAGVNTEVNNPTTSVVQPETAPQGAVEGETSQETAESGTGIKTTQPTLEQVVASLPKTNKGEIDYKAMTPQQQFQYTSLSESPEVALEDLQADIAANEEEIAKVQEQLAKARGGQRAELRDKVKKLASANEELKTFYGSVAPKQETPVAETESIEPVNNKAQEAVEEVKPIVVETEKPKKAKKPKLVGKKKKKESEFTDEELRPANGVELAAEQFAAGNIKITIDSYKKETGHGEEERKKMGLTPFRGVDKGGLTIEQAAEKLVEEDNANHNGRIFDGDTMAARDAIIELFGSTEKWGDVTGYIKNNRIAERKKREEAEYAEYEDYITQTFHMSVADYEAAKEYDSENNPFVDMSEEDYNAIFAELYEQFQNYINNEQGRTSQTSERSDGILLEERIGDIGGNQGDASQRPAEGIGSESVHDIQAPQESPSGSEVAPSIEATNVGRMADIEARILEIEGRRNEISDEIAETPDYDTLAIAELRAEEWELDQEQAELEAEYSGLSSMNDESRAIIEAEGGEVLFRSKGKRTGTPKGDFVKRAEEWSEKTGVKVRFANRLSDVSNREARQQLLRGEKITGWYEKSTGEVVLYLPNLSSMEEVDATYIHEVVAHKGMSGLLGDRFNEFLDSVWDMMSLADKRKYWNYPGVSSEKNEEDRKRAAADEYIANTFESIDVTESVWSKLTDLIKRFLKALGIEPRITNADIANTIKKSYQRLLSGEGAEGNVSGEGARFSAKKKASKTVLPEDESSFKGSVVSDADRTKVLNNLDILQKEYEEKSSKRRKTFISDLSKALLLRNNGNNSNYADYVSVNGEEVTIRISDHNVSVKDMDNAGKSNGISIVIGRKPNEGIRDFGDSHIVEYYYNNKKLENSESNPYVEIIKSFKQTVYSGEYKDTTGLAERQEVNPTLFRVTKDKNELVAVHNISEENLRKVLNVGGLIMPSIAITKADMGHEGYGEISLLFDKETINPSDRRNKVYGGDAWTPRFPQMTPKLNDKVSLKVYKKIKELISDRILSENYSLSAELHSDNIERTISDRGIEGYYDKEWMKLAYLLDRGKKVKVPIKTKDYGNMSETIIEMAKERGLKVSDIQQSSFDFYQNNSDFVDAVKKVVDEKELSSFPEEKREALRKLLGEKEMRFNYFDTLISAATRMEYDLEHGGLRQIIDRQALRETIEKKVKINNADYNKWVDNLFEGIVEKYGIRNDRDWYTPLGNLRPWGQLYDEATPANILKHMLAENEQGGSGGFFDSNIMGASAETYESIEEIREKGKKRLRRLEDGEYEEWSNSVAERMSEICYGFLSAKQRDEFGASIDAKIAITNAVAKDKTAKGIYKEMKREYPGFTMEHAKKVEEIVKEIQDFAIGYFEAKPRRIVPLREVRKAIVPKKTSEDILEGLKNNGIEVATYKRGDEAARARLIKRESNGIRFRISNNNQEVFVSNAQKAVEGIKQEKATPQQWLAMIEKNGGLKAGEDKWLGLSDWLKDSTAKTLTKAEILDFINQNKIRIEEVKYEGRDEEELWEEFKQSEQGDEAISAQMYDDAAEYAEKRILSDGLDVEEEYDDAYERYVEEYLEDDVYGNNFDEAERKVRSAWTRGEFGGVVRPINDTRLNYTTEGLENKQEIALTVPTIEPWNVDDEIHFGDAGEGRAVAWVRFGETTTPNVAFINAREAVNNYIAEMREKYNVKGGDIYDVMNEEEVKHLQELTSAEFDTRDKVERVLVIDEIQSKRHQEGRERGYKNPRIEELRKLINKNEKERNKIVPSVMSIYKANKKIGLNGAKKRHEELVANLPKELNEKYRKLKDRMFEYTDEFHKVIREKAGDVPTAPFEKNWSELAFKRMLRYAAENGFDKVAWTKGEQQAERYNIGGTVSSIDYFLRGDGAYRVETYGNNGYQIESVPTEYKDGQALAEVFGKELATKMVKDLEEDRVKVEDAKKAKKEIRDKMRGMNEDSAEYESLLAEFGKRDSAQSKIDEGHSISGDGLRVGGEGMKGFYDRMLPSFVNKYVKKWGTKVQDVELPNVEEAGRFMHSVDVTDAMKESVMEGQTMFRVKRDEAQRKVDEFTSKYNSKPVFVVDSAMKDKDLEAVFDGKATAKELREVLNKPNAMGGYVNNLDKIIIFADKAKAEKMDNILFHENVHAQASTGKYNRLISYLYEFGKDNEAFARWKRMSDREEYKEYQRPEEFLAYTLTDGMERGELEDVLNVLEPSEKESLFNLLKEVGYEYEEESRRRRLDGSLSGKRSDNAGLERTDRPEDGGREEAERISAREQAERLKELFDEVGQKGLRGVVGDADYNHLMFDIFRAMPQTEREEISLNAVKSLNLDVAKAVNDYLETAKDATLWEKVVGLVRDVLRKAGFDIEITQGDVKYLLWRSRKPINKNLPLDVGEDMDARTRFRVSGGGTRFKMDKPEPLNVSDKRDKFVKEYDAFLKTGKFNFIEAFQDRMYSVKVLMDMIVEATGKKVRDYEDAYKAENQLGSTDKPMQERYLKDFYKPLLDEVQKLSDKYGNDVVERYIYCKSGLERNEVLRQRDADEAYNSAKAELDEKLAKGDITQVQYDALLQMADDQRNKTLSEDVDYSGIRGMLFNVKAQAIQKEYEEGKIDKNTRDARLSTLEANRSQVVKDWKQFAEDQVAALEGKADKAELDSLWKRINAATNETLRMDYESGMIDKATYDAEKNMMKYYVPLRNWDDTTAEEMYEYRSELVRPVSSNQKRAKGRASQADNPIATIGLMAQNAIVRGNRNKMKQKFYAFVANRETSLATVRDVWYVKDLATDTWSPQYADTTQAKDAAEFDAIMQSFEQQMEALEAQGLAFRGKLPFGMQFRANKQQKSAHVVSVMIDGKEYAVYVNGNPRAAQAINGETNSESVNNSAGWYHKLKRMYGAGLTSWNPDFIIPNMIRDGIHASTMTMLDAGPWAAIKFAFNGPRAFAQVFAMITGGGKSLVNPKYQAYFEEFVSNGGETGYTNIHTLEDYKKEYEKLMNEAKGFKPGKGIKSAFSYMGKGLEVANRIFEDVNRFNAYVSARESGESVMRSIDAAKNITVNFNRKGALSANNTVWGKIANFMSGYILFFNPAVQGIAQLVTKTKLNPKRAAAMGSAILASGLLMPMLNEMLVSAFGDDDDDYWNQSDYKRRNNWMLFTGDGYVSIPLPPVLRELYGIGDIIYGTMTGHIPAERAAMDVARQIQSAIGFINLIPEVSQEPDMVTWAKGFAPDLAAPMMDVISNTNFMGRPIAKWTDFNEYDPEYERVYKGTSKHWVELSKLLNEVGGNEVRRSDLWGNFINPAMMEHLFTSYGGGIGKTINNVAGMMTDAAMDDKENIDPFRKSPILPRFYTPNDEKTVVPAVNRKFYDYNYQYNVAKKAYKNYVEGVKSGEHPEWQKFIDEMKENGELEFIKFFENQNKRVKKVQNLLKGEPSNKKALEEQLTDLKAMISEQSFEMLK